MQEEYKHREITEKVIGCAMTVHNFLGPGFPEIFYERSLLIEINNSGLICERQIERDVFFRGISIGKRKLDLIVEGKVLLELKALSIIENNYNCQILNYLKVFGFEVGLLLNFGKPSLEFKRFAMSKNLRNPLNP
jgi:GxxExxY protein